ncbi:hypothetical protein DHB64_07905 [Antarcticibacterium sp. W02-3]|nr:hypothetical protein [Antarcticibacterium sp. W02-3]
MKFQIPSTKFQTTNSRRQSPNSKKQSERERQKMVKVLQCFFRFVLFCFQIIKGHEVPTPPFRHPSAGGESSKLNSVRLLFRTPFTL